MITFLIEQMLVQKAYPVLVQMSHTYSERTVVG